MVTAHPKGRVRRMKISFDPDKSGPIEQSGHQGKGLHIISWQAQRRRGQIYCSTYVCRITRKDVDLKVVRFNSSYLMAVLLDNPRRPLRRAFHLGVPNGTPDLPAGVRSDYAIPSALLRPRPTHLLGEIEAFPRECLQYREVSLRAPISFRRIK